MSQTEILLWAGLWILAYKTAIWALSVFKRDTSIVDIFWGAGFVLAAVVYYLSADGWDARKLLVLSLVAVWGLRLSVHLAVRNHGQPEDKRYRAMREKRPQAWWWRSFITVFLLQDVLLWTISLPLLSAQTADAPAAWTIWDLLGLTLWAIGFFFEATADWQLLRFKRNPANKGKVLSSGLWRYSRHPNYFGETVIWWGFFLLAVPSGQYWTIVSPIVITVLLLKFSGVTLLEKDLKNSKPGYRQYIQETNAFIPWLPKTEGNRG